MGAPRGNCNAAKNKSACKVKKGKTKKGWYEKSGSKKLLYKKMGAANRRRRVWSSQDRAGKKQYKSSVEYYQYGLG